MYDSEWIIIVGGVLSIVLPERAKCDTIIVGIDTPIFYESERIISDDIIQSTTPCLVERESLW